MADYPLIRGQLPDSWQEVYLATALERYQIPYYYQYVIGRDPSIRGAIIVDFVLLRPFKQPIEIFGSYWHSGKLGADDKLKLAIERSYFGRDTIVIMADELPDQSAANKYVQREILR